ncbi:MAG: RecQ family ATP-dependent DNA helicase [Treponema sp.]|nr:RecQ family ATP-dependent DNA helicase [Treponema sp.]
MSITKSPLEILKNVFGYDSFRFRQNEIIESILKGVDTLAIMPTGAGKSLCYQIPSLIFEGLTLVISPLISLMQDQVQSLNAVGINAVFLNSSLDYETYIHTIEQIVYGKVKLIFVSPEGLFTSKIQELFNSEKINISLITVDEAHCVSQWGHDFRPDYLRIAEIKKIFPKATFLSLTASATKKVQEDIVKNLRLKTPNIFLSSFNRPNIFLNICQKQDAFKQVISCIKRHQGESGIIYCFSRRQVDDLTLKLQKTGYNVLSYHAGLTDKERKENQDKFINDEIQIIVATVAFGMGINKPNVRFVIHYDLPKSLEQYYQEIGRAGRDGLASEALLLYSQGDIVKIRYFFEDSFDRKNSERLLQEMIHFASCKVCRRKTLLTYFGESYTAHTQNENAHAQNTSGQNTVFQNTSTQFPCCDICEQGELPLTDITIPSQKIMSCIIRTGNRFGSTYIVDVLIGSKQKRILENSHDKISTYGIGKDTSKEMWYEIIQALIDNDYLLKSDEYFSLLITQKGFAALKEREPILLPISDVKRKKEINSIKLKQKNEVQNISENDLFIALKKWRLTEAKEQNVPPYIIFGDKTLHELVQYMPETEDELKSIYGIGESKIERYGKAILKIIASYS